MADERLLKAAEDGDIESLKYLLTAGECNINVQNSAWETPLHWAAVTGHTQCVQLLLQHGADTNKKDMYGWTPLHRAAHDGHTQFVQLLLQHGADTSIPNAGGMTPLHLAAEYGQTQCVQLLLQHGADTNIQDKHGWTPLHLAARDGHTQCVQFLLQHGADANIQSVLRMTPLHWAAEYGQTQCVQLLLQHGADTSIQDKDGMTLLHLAAHNVSTQCVQLLLQHGAVINIQNNVGRTPLHLAARDGNTQCVQLLLQQGADTSIQDMYGSTPLHWAVDNDHTQCVQLLLQHGANTSIQDLWEKTPRMLAEEEGHVVIAEQLRRIEIPDVQVYVQNRTLENLAEILEPAEYTFITQTNLSSNFPGVFQFQKVQELKVWATKNNCTNIRDLKAGLQAANQPRLSRVAADYYAAMVTKISNMAPNEFEALCRTQVTAKHMCISGATTTDQQETSSSLAPLRYDAFIAHSGKDKDVVEPVIEQLEEQGVRCCNGRRDFRTGKSLITSIGEAVDESKHTIVFLSKSFMESPFCEKEREFALHKAVESREYVVIPVLMDLIPQQIPRELKLLKYIPIKHEELIPKLVQSIKDTTQSPTYGELQNALQDERKENAFLRDENRELKAKLRQQCQ